MKTSHDYAQELKRIADELLARPQFLVPNHSTVIHLNHKPEMLAAVKALGSGEKKYGDYFFDFVPAFSGQSNLSITILKNELCRKIQDAVWECDPLLADSKEAAA